MPKLDEPGATNPTTNRLSFPNGFGLALDKGDTPGQDTPQGYCSPAFGIKVADRMPYSAASISASATAACRPPQSTGA